MRVHWEVKFSTNEIKKMANLIQNGGCISGSSDPYAILTVGAKTYQSPTVNNSCDPVWNATYDFPIGKSILHCVSVYFFLGLAVVP